MTNKYFLLLLPLLFLAPSCKDDDETKAPEYYEFWLGEAKDYLFFKPGSWWAYKNMQTGEVDTLYCTWSRLDTFTVKGNYNYSKHRTYKIETMRVMYKSKRFGEYYEFYNRGPNPDATNTPPLNSVVFTRLKSGGGAQIMGDIFRMPFKLSTKSNSGLQVFDTTVSLSNNVKYSNVALFRNYTDPTFPSILEPIYYNTPWQTDIYYAKGYGIIQYTWNDVPTPSNNKHIELIDHQIIQ